MELLITPAEVARRAFRAPDFMVPDAVSETAILAVQQRFVRPVVGARLYEALCRGEYPSLSAEYIVPALALYVKLSMLPALAVQAGAAGVAEAYGKNLSKAGEGKLRGAVRALRRDADALMRRAVEHIEVSAESYPEYDPRENVLNRLSIEGGVVLDKR